MCRSTLVAGAMGLALLVLGGTVALAAYGPGGPVGVSNPQPPAGGTVTVSGTGFRPGSEVRVTIESTPQLLATVTADGSGAFSVDVTIPDSLSGARTIVATGTDAQGSVRVLSSPISVAAALPSLSTTPGPGPAPGPAGLLVAVVVVVVVAAVVLLAGAGLLIVRRNAGR